MSNKKIYLSMIKISLPLSGTVSSKPVNGFTFLLGLIRVRVGRFLRAEFDRRGSLGKSKE